MIEKIYPATTEGTLEQLTDCLNNLIQRIDKLEGKHHPKFGEWISTKDRLPEDREEVIVFYNFESKYEWTYSATFKRLKNGNNYFIGKFKTPVREINYWMPLPMAPK